MLIIECKRCGAEEQQHPSCVHLHMTHFLVIPMNCALKLEDVSSGLLLAEEEKVELRIVNKKPRRRDRDRR